MSLTYRNAVRGLIREKQGGLKKNECSRCVCCISSLKVAINYISKDAPNAVKIGMIAAVSGGGEISHPALFF